MRWLRGCRHPTCCQGEDAEEAPEEPEVPRHRRYKEERRQQKQTASKAVTFEDEEVTEQDSSRPNFGSTESEIGRTFLRTINRGNLPPDNPLRVAERRHIFRPKK